MMRAAFALLAAGCVPGTDFGGTAYRCDVDPTCPDGFVCTDGVCLAPGDDGDGAGDALVPAGTVVMGCEAGAACAADAQPEHEVSLAAFSIDRTEVTEADYAEHKAEAPLSVRCFIVTVSDTRTLENDSSGRAEGQ